MEYEPNTTLGDLATVHKMCLTEPEVMLGWTHQEGVGWATFLMVRDEMAEEVLLGLLELMGYSFDDIVADVGKGDF